MVASATTGPVGEAKDAGSAQEFFHQIKRDHERVIRTMERGSLDKLKYDNRLASRKGWIDTTDRDSFVDSLPDVGDKVAVPEEPQATSGAPEEPAAPAPVVEEPVSQPLNPLSPPFQEVSE